MKINIFNIHYEISAYMFNNQDRYEHLDLIQRHQLCERYAQEFISSLGDDVEFDIINDDLYDEIETFIKSKIQPKPNPREL